jgi:hypothetical protein
VGPGIVQTSGVHLFFYLMHNNQKIRLRSIGRAHQDKWCKRRRFVCERQKRAHSPEVFNFNYFFGNSVGMSFSTPKVHTLAVSMNRADITKVYSNDGLNLKSIRIYEP